MSSPALKEEILTELARLPVEKQRTVLQFVRNLASDRPAGVPGQALVRFAGSIAPADLNAMRDAIDDGCEQVDAHEW